MKHPTLPALILAALLLSMSVFTVTAGSTFFINFGFENKQQSDGETPELAPWTVENKSGDKIKCATVEKPIPTIADCSFMFKGAVGEAAKLKQTVRFQQRGIEQTRSERYVCVSPGLYSESAATEIKIKVKVIGTGEDEKFKTTYTHTGVTDDEAPGVNWIWSGCDYFDTNTAVLVPDGVSIDRVKLTIVNKSQSGKAYIDDVYGWVIAPA